MMGGVSDRGSSDRRPALKGRRLSKEDVDRESSTFIQTECVSGPALSDGEIQTPSTMLHRNLRKRKSSVLLSNPIKGAMKPLTEEEKRNWRGWAELESEPALFSYILRSYGVEGVKIQEVLGLEMLPELPKPVFGLIFLFNYQHCDTGEVGDLPKCPKHIWFANQTTDNACATVALLNIVMNVCDLQLGDTLSAFKKSTLKLKSAYRGEQLSRNDYIRTIHNSFARRMDVLNSDLWLSNAYEEWVGINKTAKRALVRNKVNTSKGNSKPQPHASKNEDQASYHFIAYVPIDDCVYRLDGLQRQPVAIGEAGHDWISIARSDIVQHYQSDSIEYNLMSLCRSPLLVLPGSIAQNIKATRIVEQALQVILPDWMDFIEPSEPSITVDMYAGYGISQLMLDCTTVSSEVTRMLLAESYDPSVLLDRRRKLREEQMKLTVAYDQELAAVEHENELAQRRRQDQTSMIYNSIRVLSEVGDLGNIVSDS